MIQRLRLTFSRGEELKYISHLDLMRLWQRALRRADIPLAYSKGFSPHPKISLASPLAIGVTSSGELMDVFLEHRVSPHFFLKSLSPQLPRGIYVSEIEEIGLGLPSLQSQVLYAEYEVCVETDKDANEVEVTLRSLLDKVTLPWQHIRDKEVRSYDLRRLIENVQLLHIGQHECTLGMRLRCDKKGTGRPEQVTLALGFDTPPRYIHRARLILDRQNKHIPLN
jgi:radical SAM-linked protein